MKKIIYVLLIAALPGNTAFAQKISADKVPAAVASAFKTKFPAAKKITWEMENKTEFEANFKLNAEEVSANFDNSGTWLETETEITIAALPASVQSTIKNNFPGFKINEASKIENAKNGSCYETEIEKAGETFDVLFTAGGKLLSKTKVEDEKDGKD